jgi:hypothetical protein
MKHFIAALFCLTTIAVLHSQTNPNQSLVRLQIGGVVSSYGYVIGFSDIKDGTKLSYIQLMPKVQASLKLSRKNELYGEIGIKNVKTNTSKYEPGDGDNYFEDLKFESSYKNINYKIFSFGVRHFIKNQTSPVGSYFGLGATFAKVSATPLAYEYLNNNSQLTSGIEPALDYIIPSISCSFGKRILLSDKVYFNNEFQMALNQFEVPAGGDFNYKKYSWFSANRLTNFGYFFSIGVLL